MGGGEAAVTSSAVKPEMKRTTSVPKAAKNPVALRKVTSVVFLKRGILGMGELAALPQQQHLQCIWPR